MGNKNLHSYTLTVFLHSVSVKKRKITTVVAVLKLREVDPQEFKIARFEVYNIGVRTDESAYVRTAQLRKLEGPNYQHKFAACRKSLFHFDVEIQL